MTSLPARATLSDPADWNLEFPSGGGQLPAGHTYTVRQVIEFSETLLPFITQAPGFEEERFASKCPVQFELLP